MGFLGLGGGAGRRQRGNSSSNSATTVAAAAATTDTPTSTTRPPSLDVIEGRLRNALWSFFAGDALAAPTHWFYGGEAQVRQYYGPDGITGYTRPSYQLAGSLLNKSDPSGGGRAKASGKKDAPKSIIGDVINHGKLELWDPHKQIHYHATLQSGENTLEAQLARVAMKSIVATGGIFDPNHFRQSYVDFMTTPGSHNDAYASTCHRMFFANMVYRNLPLDQCPDNDGHNVDTVDGLVVPTMVALGATARAACMAIRRAEESTDSGAHCDVPWLDDVARQTALCASVTRKSPVLEKAAAAWGQLVGSVLWQGNSGLAGSANDVAVSLRLRRKPRVVARTELTACYLDSALPALLDDLVSADALHTPVWNALLRNANAGGENVHRGSCLGAVLGASASTPVLEGGTALDLALVSGLHDRADLENEIDAFVASVLYPVVPPSLHGGSQVGA